MTKRIFIIHRWEETPEGDWYPWVKNQLEQKGYHVIVPEMPDTDSPKIDTWVSKLSDTVGKLEHTDSFITHSIGAQTVLRYLESQDEKCDKVIMIAPWLELIPESLDDDEKEIARPWIETPIDFTKVNGKANSIIGIFSDNDEYVNYVENQKLFNEKLQYQGVLENGKGHFTKEEGVTELPMVINLFS